MKLSKREFREWLKTKPADAVVGLPCRCDKCPIATYLVETIDAPVRITERTFRVYIGMCVWEEFEMPVWARRFVRRVDTHGTADGVSAIDALYMLHIVDILK